MFSYFVIPFFNYRCNTSDIKVLKLMKKKGGDSRLKKRLKCSNCNRRLNSIFQVCICRKLCCPYCSPPINHNCTLLTTGKNQTPLYNEKEETIDNNDTSSTLSYSDTDELSSSSSSANALKKS